MKKIILLIVLAVFTANVSASTNECENFKPRKHKKHKNKRHGKRKLGKCYGLGSLPKVRR
jgi:Ni/Co efflux regulator RcnB